jgi:hypothetical protein
MLQQAINELSRVKSVEEWNEVRAKYVKNKNLTREELAKVDSEGLIVKILGRDKNN